MRYIYSVILAMSMFMGAAEELELPTFSAVDTLPKVVATTSIIGDVVFHVAGDMLEVVTLMPAGQDPHSYQATAKELVHVARADVIFVNGWDLEEGVIADIKAIAAEKIAPVAAGVVGLESSHNASHDAHHHHHSADPHTWFSIPAVMQWTDNIAKVLSQLDTANAQQYRANAEEYKQQLRALHAANRIRFARLPDNKRFLITNHDAFGYLADAYDIQILGTIIPSFSSQAEPSARDMVQLIDTMKEYGLCSIVTEVAGNQQLAQAIAQELDDCENVRIISLYTGALGEEGSGAETYIAMYRTNVQRIIDGL